MPDRRIATYTGKLVDPFDLQEKDISLDDIAHALSMTCRYGGHVGKFYSVAEHCLIMTKHIMELHAPVEECRACLLHDADEAYLTDLPNPIKREPEFKFYHSLGCEIRDRVFSALGLPLVTSSRILDLDKEMVVHEAGALFHKIHTNWRLELSYIPTTFQPVLACLNPYEAESKFLKLATLLGLFHSETSEAKG
jgi:uncharacterized protein